MPPPHSLRVRCLSRSITPLLNASRPQYFLRRTHSTTASIDPSEVSHFNALASEWWDPHGSSRLLHLMNPLRLRFLQSCLDRGGPTRSATSLPTPTISASTSGSTPQDLRYLDVGCGGGILAESLARLGSTDSVLGIDPSPEVLKVAREHMRQDPALRGRLRYENITVDALPVPPTLGEGFDVVTAMEVLEHVPAPQDFLMACMRHVRPGGWLVGSTIARTWTSWFTTKLVAEDLLGIVPRGTHDWNKYVNIEELRGFFRGAEGWGSAKGMIIAVMGCAYLPGFGWREMPGGEGLGNYFFGIRREEGIESSR